MYKTFIFESYSFDKKTNTLVLSYSYDEKLFFEETITFPYANSSIDLKKNNTLDKIFKYIHLACGISYYKLFVPNDIAVKTFKLSKQEKDFFDNFYFNGLGEFSYRNNITNLKERINFPFDTQADNRADDIKLNKKYFVAVGGGKDSITTIELLNTYTNDFGLISIGTAKSIENTIKVSGLKAVQPTRKISPNLLELNKKLDEIKGYNGHIPITGVLAFIFIACAVLYDFDTILLSNEKSANVGNVKFGNSIVNHQWSKSFEFEKSFNDFCHRFILKNFHYISFLRPLTEIHIAKIFSKFTQYHSIFTSCNKNFKIVDRIENWCCNCDKCRFVFLILSVFLNKQQMLHIFGKNLFEDKTQLEGFYELCGLKNFKPFECVGEIEESIYAILNTNKDFKNDFIVKDIREKLKDKDYDYLEQKLFSFDEKNNLLTDELMRVMKNGISKVSI